MSIVAKCHPHPFDPDIKCGRCRFWHPAYVDDYALFPNGQAMPVAQARASGAPINSYLTVRMSQCFFNPAWMLEGENQYCGHFDPAEKH